MIKWDLKHFTPDELLSPDGMRELARGNLMLNWESAKLYDGLRSRINAPLICNFGQHRRRAYRSIAENQAVFGGIYSRHVQGIAFDSHSPDANPLELAVEAILHGFSAVGVYKTFTHKDTRHSLTGEIVIWVQKAKHQEMRRIKLTNDTFNRSFLTEFIKAI